MKAAMKTTTVAAAAKVETEATTKLKQRLKSISCLYMLFCKSLFFLLLLQTGTRSEKRKRKRKERE